MLIDLTDQKQWDKILNSLKDFPGKTYYQFWYARACEIADSAKAHAIYFEGPDTGRVFYPFLLKQIPKEISKDFLFSAESFYGYGGPHFQECTQNDIKAFFVAQSQWFADHNVIAEFLRFNPLTQNHLHMNSYCGTEKNRTTVLVNLNSADKNFDPFKDFSAARIRNYKKALNSNLTIKRSNDIDNFKEIYNNTMTRVNASRYLRFSDDYFSHLSQLLNTSDEILLYEVHNSKNQCIAASIFFTEKTGIHYHLGGMNKDFKETYPTVFLFSEIIKIGKALKKEYLHLGGGLSLDKNDGLFRFKKGFSSKTLDFYIGKKIHNSIIYTELSDKWVSLSKRKPVKFLHFHDEIL